MIKMILLALLVLTLLASDAALAQQQRQAFKDATGRTLGQRQSKPRDQLPPPRLPERIRKLMRCSNRSDFRHR
jgi:hypothetical protein